MTIIYLLFCANLLWAIFDKSATIDKIINAERVKYALLFILEFAFFMIISQIHTLENCKKLKLFYKIIYLVGISLIIISFTVAYYYKTLFLLLPAIIGIIISMLIVIKILRQKYRLSGVKVKKDIYCKYLIGIWTNKDYKNYFGVMAFVIFDNNRFCQFIFMVKLFHKTILYCNGIGLYFVCC